MRDQSVKADIDPKRAKQEDPGDEQRDARPTEEPWK
jgi:hypothetical protein